MEKELNSTERIMALSILVLVAVLIYYGTRAFLRICTFNCGFWAGLVCGLLLAVPLYNPRLKDVK